MWYVYILRCADASLYTGITTNIHRRLKEHNSQGLGARYTRARRPVEIMYFEESENRSSASVREYEIKQKSRKEKLELIQKAEQSISQNQQ